jgi:hypothetical protein
LPGKWLTMGGAISYNAPGREKIKAGEFDA